MSGNFTHSEADIIRWMLIGLGQGTDPDLDPQQTWPIYATKVVERPDNVITVANTNVRDHGRNMFGERSLHYGFQIRLRSHDDEVVQLKAKSVADALDQALNEVVTLGGINYCVHSVSITGHIIDGGFETPTSKRVIKFINALAHILRL